MPIDVTLPDGELSIADDGLRVTGTVEVERQFVVSGVGERWNDLATLPVTGLIDVDLGYLVLVVTNGPVDWQLDFAR